MVHHVVRALVVAACAVVLCSCARETATPPPGDEWTLPESTAAGPSKSAAVPTGTITGSIGFDDIEGGCAFVEAADGVRYEVVYPDGWEVDRLSGEIRGPDGQVVRAGEGLTLRGNIATDRSSICQIGPIFVAEQVEVPAR